MESEQILASWREAGAWWREEPGLEITVRAVDGRRVEERRELPPLVLRSRRLEYEDSAAEDCDLRARGAAGREATMEAARRRMVASRPMARR